MLQVSIRTDTFWLFVVRFLVEYSLRAVSSFVARPLSLSLSLSCHLPLVNWTVPLADWFPLGETRSHPPPTHETSEGVWDPLLRFPAIHQGCLCRRQWADRKPGVLEGGRVRAGGNANPEPLKSLATSWDCRRGGLLRMAVPGEREKLRTPGPDCFGAAKVLFAGRLRTNHGHAHYDSPDAAWRSDVNKSICCGLPRVCPVRYKYMRCMQMDDKKSEAKNGRQQTTHRPPVSHPVRPPLGASAPRYGHLCYVLHSSTSWTASTLRLSPSATPG